MEKMVSNTAELQTIILEPVDYLPKPFFNSFVTVAIFEISNIAFFIILVAPEDVLNLPYLLLPTSSAKFALFSFNLFVCFFFFA